MLARHDNWLVPSAIPLNHASSVQDPPQSVLVVIYTPTRDVLLINRADAPNYWQSVTGSKDDLNEDLAQTAVREVFEETGIDCGSARSCMRA